MKSNTIRSSSPKTGYSATVEMFLNIGGVRHDLSHMGPEFIILTKPMHCPPCEGVVGLTVDGRLKQWPVRLPDGILDRHQPRADGERRIEKPISKREQEGHNDNASY